MERVNNLLDYESMWDALIDHYQKVLFADDRTEQYKIFAMVVINKMIEIKNEQIQLLEKGLANE